MTQQMKVKAKFDNFINLDSATKSLVNFFMSDAGLYMYGNYKYTPAVKAGFEYTKQVSLDAVQIILSGEAAEAGESGNNLSLHLYKDASKITIQLFDSDTLVFKNEKSYAEYDDPISAYDINNATNALDPETKGIDFFELSGNIPLADISDNPLEPTKFDFTGGRDAVDDGVDGIKASILQNHRTFTLTENDDVEYTTLWVPYTNTAITDDVDVVSNICSIPDVASTLTQATSNLYLGKYTYQETGGGSGSGSGSSSGSGSGSSSGSGSGSGDTSVKAHVEVPYKYGQVRAGSYDYNPMVIEAIESGNTGNELSIKFELDYDNDLETGGYACIVTIYRNNSPIFTSQTEREMQKGEYGYEVTQEMINALSDNNDSTSINSIINASGGSIYLEDDEVITLQLSNEPHATAELTINGKAVTMTAVEAGSSGADLHVVFNTVEHSNDGNTWTNTLLTIYRENTPIFEAESVDPEWVGDEGHYESSYFNNKYEDNDDTKYFSDYVLVSIEDNDFYISSDEFNNLDYEWNLSIDSNQIVEIENVANVSNTSLIDSMSAAAKHNYLVSGISLNKSVTIKPYIGDVINTDSSLYPSGIMPGVSEVSVDFSIGEDDRIDFQLRTSSFTVEDKDNQKHNSMYYRIGIYPLGDNTVDDIKGFLITDLQHNDGHRLVTGMTGTAYDKKVFYLENSFSEAADTFYVESIFDHGAAYNFPSKAIFPYRGTYISNYDAILYMQLCNSNGIPSDSIGVINGIEVSLDGETWNTAEHGGDTNLAALDIVELTEENKTLFIPVSVN